MQLWELRSSTVCHLQTGHSGKPLVYSLKAWEPESQWPLPSGSRRPENQERWEQQKSLQSGRELIQSLLPFCSLQALSGWSVPTHPPEGETSALPSPPIQMLISSRNALTDSPRNDVKSALWAFLGPVQLMLTGHNHVWHIPTWRYWV